jgi:preprotein translocase subunit YajC
MEKLYNLMFTVLNFLLFALFFYIFLCFLIQQMKVNKEIISRLSAIEKSMEVK